MRMKYGGRGLDKHWMQLSLMTAVHMQSFGQVGRETMEDSEYKGNPTLRRIIIRMLRNIIVHPLPRIEDILDTWEDAKY